jgi:hypothetical protein
MRTYKDAKMMAKSLRGSLATGNVLLSHSKCLEIVAKQFGFADWNTLSATLDLESDHVARAEDGSGQISRTAAPEQLSCSFCDKSPREVRSLIEGRCSSRTTSPCVFICDECVALCAQINADTVGDATSLEDPAIS